MRNEIITLTNRLAIVVGSRYECAVRNGTTRKHELTVVDCGGIITIARAVRNGITRTHYDRLARGSSGFVFFDSCTTMYTSPYTLHTPPPEYTTQVIKKHLKITTRCITGGTLYTTPLAVSCLILTMTPPRYHLGGTLV